jgi:hypothetical protein
LILALADSKSFSAVEAEVNTSRPTTARWKARFERAGSRDSKARHKGSRVREATPDVQARLLRKTQQKPGDDSTHWSCRKMAAAIGQSPATVYRIWSKTSLNPHRVDRYMASKDSAFEEKTAEIVGLYMEPPQHAALSCVDEKTAIQAMNRLHPSCRYLRGALKSTDSNTIDTARCRYTRRWSGSITSRPLPTGSAL